MSNLPVKSNGANIVAAFLEKNKAKIVAAMPRHVNGDTLMRAAIQAINKTPALSACTAQSLCTSIVQASLLGLECNGPLGEAYLVPYKTTCTFIPGYRGLMQLAHRSGKIKAFWAAVAYAGEPFKVTLGTHPEIEHERVVGSETGDIVAFYAVVQYVNGGCDFEVMSTAEVGAIRDASPASKAGPWVDHPIEMAKKTVIRRLAKRIPMSAEMASAIRIDDQVAGGEVPDLDALVLDIVGDRVDGEAKGARPQVPPPPVAGQPGDDFNPGPEHDAAELPGSK